MDRCPDGMWPTCYLTGQPLVRPGDMRFLHQFAHVLPKGAYPRWKEVAANIRLLHPDVHASQESYPEWKALQDGMKAAYYAGEDPTAEWIENVEYT